MLTHENLKMVLAVGETVGVEFNRCGNGIENDVYETVCSFLNRFGGDIFLGVLDNGTVAGLPKEAAPHLIRNFISCISNPAMITPTVYLSPEIMDYEGKTIIRIHVPPSAEVHSFKRVIYDRVDDADVKVTATAQIAQMYIRKQEIYTERKIYPYINLEDLRLDLLQELKTRVINNAPGQDHPWAQMSEPEILKSARLFSRDKVTGAVGYNLACVLLLGKDDTIGDVVPAYVTDALLRRVNTDRYDDREVIQTNLIDSYRQLGEFAAKHLPDKFFVEGMERKSLRGIIVREITANTLIHREFTSAYRAKFVIESDRMYVENANRSAQAAILTPNDIEPNPKNPIIANFFRTIGLADQLGSVIRNLFHYCKYYSNGDPQFIEGDVFRIIVPLDDSYSWDAKKPSNSPLMSVTDSVKRSKTQENTHQAQENTYQTQREVHQDKRITKILENPISKKILTALAENSDISISKLAVKLDCTVDTVKYHLQRLKRVNAIKRLGTNQKGHWVVEKSFL